MKRVGAVVAAMLIVPMTSAAAGLEHVGFNTSSGELLVGSSSRTYELSIDDAVRVNVDEKALTDEFGAASATAGSASPLRGRIELLERTVKALFEAQERLIAAKTATLSLRYARGTGAEPAAQAAAKQANNEFADVAEAVLQPLSDALDSDPELKASLEAAIMEAVQEDYGKMAGVVKVQLERMGADLAHRAESGRPLEVYLEAWITDGALRGKRVHLDGYDDVLTGEPVPFPRFQIALDERTKEDLAAAERLSTTINGVISGSFQNEIKNSLKAIGNAVRGLAKTIKSDVLGAELAELTRAVVAARDDSLGPVINDLVSVRDLLSGFQSFPAADDLHRPDRLLMLANELSSKVTQLQALANDAPKKLENLGRSLERLARERPDLINKKIVASVLTAKTDLESELAPLREVLTQLRAVARSIGIASDVATAVDTATSKPRELGVGVSLDTHFDLQTIKEWQRRPGDQVSVTLKIMPKGEDPAKTPALAFARQKFRLEAYGPYLESRAGVLFVDSREASIAKRSFETVPGATFHLKYGFKNRPFLNEWIAPGLGFSLSMLDFDNNKSLEIGIAGSVTLIRDLFWVGYGRNLQAQADYFFVGINPIALGGLFRQRIP